MLTATWLRKSIEVVMIIKNREKKSQAFIFLFNVWVKNKIDKENKPNIYNRGYECVEESSRKVDAQYIALTPQPEKEKVHGADGASLLPQGFIEGPES